VGVRFLEGTISKRDVGGRAHVENTKLVVTVIVSQTLSPPSLYALLRKVVNGFDIVVGVSATISNDAKPATIRIAAARHHFGSAWLLSQAITPVMGMIRRLPTFLLGTAPD